MSIKNVLKNPVILIVLDGFGYSKKTFFNAIYHAKKPYFQVWIKKYPHTLLKASGASVGLLSGQMSNSEVGHLTIGAGRIVKQMSTRIMDSLTDDSFSENKLLVKIFKNAAKNKKRLHLIGLLSDGGVHAHQKICDALLKMAKNYHVETVFVHAFLDGRDVPPKSAKKYLTHLDRVVKKFGIGKLGSMSGRYFAMDRDQNWDRTQVTYEVLTQKKSIHFLSWRDALFYCYDQGITDEFIPPIQFLHESIIKTDDNVIFFNFRADRARQLTAAFCDSGFGHFKTKKIDLDFFATLTDYDHNHFKTDVIFKPVIIRNTFKEVLEKNGKTIVTIAETEKYAHVTYFFDGGREQIYKNETRILIPSISTKNYIRSPKMSAMGITNAVIESLENDPCDFYLINYANADMVGHSGNYLATIKAIECLDLQLGLLYEKVIKEFNGTLFITADHGNAEEMFDRKTGQPKTSHTKNPVYFLMLKKGLKQGNLTHNLQGLADIAPFILKEMHLLVPKEMKKVIL